MGASLSFGPPISLSAVSGRSTDLIEAVESLLLEKCGPDFRPGPASHPRPQYFAEKTRVRPEAAICGHLRMLAPFPAPTWRDRPAKYALRCRVPQPW